MKPPETSDRNVRHNNSQQISPQSRQNKARASYQVSSDEDDELAEEPSHHGSPAGRFVSRSRSKSLPRQPNPIRRNPFLIFDKLPPPARFKRLKPVQGGGGSVSPKKKTPASSKPVPGDGFSASEAKPTGLFSQSSKRRRLMTAGPFVGMLDLTQSASTTSLSPAKQAPGPRRKADTMRFDNSFLPDSPRPSGRPGKQNKNAADRNQDDDDDLALAPEPESMRNSHADVATNNVLSKPTPDRGRPDETTIATTLPGNKERDSETSHETTPRPRGHTHDDGQLAPTKETKEPRPTPPDTSHKARTTTPTRAEEPAVVTEGSENVPVDQAAAPSTVIIPGSELDDRRVPEEHVPAKTASAGGDQSSSETIIRETPPRRATSLPPAKQQQPTNPRRTTKNDAKSGVLVGTDRDAQASQRLLQRAGTY